jgi:hypothetical protein
MDFWGFAGLIFFFPASWAPTPAAAKSGENSQITVRKRLNGLDWRADENRITSRRASHVLQDKTLLERATKK